MPTTRLNGVSLYYELSGEVGPPLVLVHGSWVDHENWAAVVPELAKRFRVLTYDRRGHSQSERPPGQGSVHEDVEDLDALITELALAAAHIVGNSFGAVIALWLAGRRTDCFRSLTIHEPPLLGVLAADPNHREMASAVQARVGSIAEQLSAGDIEGGSRRFVEEVAFGPGAWGALPAALHRTFIANAPTWLDECRDPDALGLELRTLAGLAAPAYLTQGDQSPPFFGAVLDRIAKALPHAERFTFRGSGHVPHMTHPDMFVAHIRERLS